MSPRRLSPSAAAKRALLAGAAIAVLWAPVAHAQAAKGFGLKQASPTRAANNEPKSGSTPDGLAAGELLIEADQVVRDDEAKRTTAEGSVEMRYQARTLRADKVVYEQDTGVVRAYGHVQIINADGTVEYAEQLTLDDKMRTGVALGFSARLGQEVKIAAASAVRRNETIQELNHAIFTPCPICVDNKPHTPTWSISADRVIQDKKRRVIFYRNARIHVLGAPVLFLPVFWHADPTAARSSGFLAPGFSTGKKRGVSLEVPYLWVISPYSDLTVTPQINSQVAPFVEARLRKRFYSGEVDFRVGYTHDRDFSGNGTHFGDNTNRSYILGRGAFQVDDKWRWGFTAERTSDKLIFDKYDIGEVYTTRGPYVADDRRLISQIYAVRQDDRSYFSTAAFSVQGLRPGDNDRTFPLVAPLIEGHYEPNADVLGGRLRLQGSAVVLTRDQSPTVSVTPLPGLDSRRVTAEADWSRTFISSAGLRVDPFVSVRADAYSLSDVLNDTNTATHGQSLGRTMAVAGADITYPFYRRWHDATVVLEPVAQVALSPHVSQVIIGHDATGQPIYLNEDSVAFEFDESTLLRANKFPGYDLYEDGARLNVAGRATVLWDDGRRASALIGRSFRDSPNDIFTDGSGLRHKASDWIVAADAQPMKGVSMFARARLDSDNLGVHRLETGANVSTKWGSGYVRYLTDDLDINGRKSENMDVGGELYLSKHWGVTAYGNRDFIQQGWVIRDLGVFYHDDCTRIDVIYRQEDTVIGRLGPSRSVSVRLTLATLGGPTYGK